MLLQNSCLRCQSKEQKLFDMRKQVGWNVGHNLTIGGRELAYSSSEHLKGLVTDVQVEQLTKLLSNDNSSKFLCNNNSSGVLKGCQHGRGCCLHFLLRGRMTGFCLKYYKVSFRIFKGTLLLGKRKMSGRQLGRWTLSCSGF